MECDEKAVVRDFAVSAKGDNPGLQGRKRIPRGKIRFAGPRMAVWLILNEIWMSRMEIAANTSGPRFSVDHQLHLRSCSITEPSRKESCAKTQ